MERRAAGVSNSKTSSARLASPTPNRFVGLLIDEFEGDWGEDEDQENQAPSQFRSPQPPTKSPAAEEDDDATLRQSSPVPLSPPPANEDLGNALRQVAAALADERTSTAEDPDPFAALRQFCSSPSSSMPSTARAPRSGARTGGGGTREEWDQEAAQFMNLLVQHQRARDGGGKDDCINPLLIAVEKMENRRLSLDPNWKPLAGKHEPTLLTAKETQPLFNRRSVGSCPQSEWRCQFREDQQNAQLPHKRTELPRNERLSSDDVNLPLLPPSLAGVSTTPLKERDAFARSTPPLPVRGAPDRQAYLQNRVSTQKLAERITRATRLEAARESPEVFVHVTSGSDEDSQIPPTQTRSPVFGQGSVGSTNESFIVDEVSQINESQDSETTDRSPFVVIDTDVAQPKNRTKQLPEQSQAAEILRQVAPEPMNIVMPDLGSPLFPNDDQPVVSDAPKSDKKKAAVKSRASKGALPKKMARPKRGSTKSAVNSVAERRDSIQSRESVRSQESVKTRESVKSRDSAKSRNDRVVEASPEMIVPEEEEAQLITNAEDDFPENSTVEEHVEEHIEVAGVQEPSAEHESMLSPSWATPRPALGSELTCDPEAAMKKPPSPTTCTALVVVPAASMVLHDSASDRRSMGVQVSAKAQPVRKARKALKDSSGLLMPVESKEGQLRRISICEAESEDAVVPGKIMRQRSKRIRIAPLAWWAGEHIEYSTLEGDLSKAKATAVYKVELTDPPKRKRSSKETHKLALSNNPGSSTASGGRTRSLSLTDRSRKRGRPSAENVAPPVGQNTDNKRLIPPEKYQDDSYGSEWLASLQEPLGRTLKTSMFNGRTDEVVALRSKEETWVPVSQNGYSYSVRLLLQTIRNTSVEFKLEPGRSKGQDQTRATQILLAMHTGEDHKLQVETWLGDQSGSRDPCRKTSNMAVGDWLVIPPKSHYDVTNSSRSKSCVILAHVVACDNELFKGFVDEGTDK